MCYIRGHRDDYDDWSAQGATGWSWNEVLPWFKHAEGNTRAHRQAQDEQQFGQLHGSGGPLAVSDLKHHNPLSDVFLEAALAAGHRANPDFNGAEQDGVGYYQVTQRDGARCSTAAGYLTPIRARKNLTVVTGARVNRVLIERGRATGVVCSVGGAAHCYGAAREVLLSGGALNSPQLLMLSGVGPAAQLRQHGIDVLQDAPGVGSNLQDHLDICTLQRSLKPITYDRVSDIAVAWNYYVHRRGPGTSNIAESGGFVRSALAPDQRPDVQFHFVPALLDDHGRHRLAGDGYTLHACFLRPKSRGQLQLASANPGDKIRIHANYLGDADGFDLRMMLECARLSREIFAQSAFAPYRGEEIFPGANVRDEAGLIDFIRRKAETVYHPVGTCRMGDDAGAVVDPQLRVRGIDGLRVVDASVMPTLIGGNTNAPTVMIAEKAADLILAAAGRTAKAA
jgi:choline dehydrogenase